MLGKVCYIKSDLTKEKYIIFNSFYNNEVLDIIGVNKTNRGKILHLRGEEVEIDLNSQVIIDTL